MTASVAVRALVVDEDPSLIGEYRQILCPQGHAAAESSQSLGAFETDLIGAVVGHELFPPVEVLAFHEGAEAIAAVREAVDDDQPFLVAFVDSDLKAGLGGVETAERIRAADARVQIVMMAGRSPLHPIDMVARVPPADRISFIKKPFHPFEIQHIVIGCRQRQRTEGWQKSLQSPQVGDHQPSMLLAILDCIPAGVLVFDRHDQLIAANKKLCRMFPGIADMFVPGARFQDIRWQMNAESATPLGSYDSTQVWQYGESQWALVTENVAPSGETYCLFFDVTESRLRDAARSRSMNSVHLTQAFVELCGTIDRILTEQPAADGLGPVIGRLRTVALQQNLTPQFVDLSRYLSRAARRIRRRLPNGVGLEAVIDAGLWPVVADPDGLARALAELTANACAAMPGGGQVIFEADNVRVAAGSELASLGLAAGDYVRVTIQDTGKGMPPEVVEHALVPFLSGGDGKHFGLGLPIVHAFAIRSQGWLEITGGVGSGATVRLYLPRMTSNDRGVAVGTVSDRKAVTAYPDIPIDRQQDATPGSFDIEQSP